MSKTPNVPDPLKIPLPLETMQEQGFNEAAIEHVRALEAEVAIRQANFEREIAKNVTWLKHRRTKDIIHASEVKALRNELAFLKSAEQDKNLEQVWYRQRYGRPTPKKKNKLNFAQKVAVKLFRI
ncbi:MAG: hypothetical protein F4118_00360 [Acidimicrobiaceae bacterium]|nr:hypothetical protein [Candidatus Poribacteria bacterium]MYI34874.1 hypothetical protein [Acidimicrobiaceae bacterium]